MGSSVDVKLGENVAIGTDVLVGTTVKIACGLAQDGIAKYNKLTTKIFLICINLLRLSLNPKDRLNPIQRNQLTA